MKKLLILIIGIIAIAGCSGNSKPNVIKQFTKSVQKGKTYYMSGKMELNNDEETFNYDLEVNYSDEDLYLVKMINKSNNSEQIILKNTDGLYVITPALNKSFKFESTWPKNSSQAYILSAIINDIELDEQATVEESGDGFIIKCKVNYPNNSDLKYEKIYLDKDYNLKKVEVYSEADLAKIIVEITNYKLNTNIEKDIFDLKNYVSEDACDDKECKNETTMSQIESAIYPLYMPSNTYLSSSDVVNSETDGRIILTFAGEKNFVIVEESAIKNNAHEIIPVYGEPLMLNDTIAALSDNSMYWTSNDIDYYLVSEDLSTEEMIFVASSLGNSISTIASK